MEKLKVMYFSPVGGTKRVAEGIVSELRQDKVEWIDLCLPENRLEDIHFTKEDSVLMVFPVYAGRVVRIPRYYFKRISAAGAKAVTVVTYGNRAYDDALLELKMLAEQSGFDVIGAAAFVCEHSFGIGLATGRPDHLDLTQARLFGRVMFDGFINQAVENGRVEENLLDNHWRSMNDLPGLHPFRTQFRHDFGGPLVPSTKDQCMNCKRCAKSCPAEAIPIDNPKETDNKKCIICFRCIRQCPVQARTVALQDFIIHAKWLAEAFKERKEPELYR